MVSFKPELEICPCCGNKGSCKIHAYYKRWITDFIGGRKVQLRIRVLRVICENCGHTHAILPDAIIPYDSYSLLFILRVLAARFFLHHTIELLCERFQITQNQFYKWMNLWHTHKEVWLGMLPSAETSDIAFIRSIASENRLSDFTAAFVQLTSHSFLQSHRNPANYCQRRFST